MTPSLSVNRAELAQGLKMLAKFAKPARAGEAILSFEDGSLKIELGGLAVSAAASGCWPGQARVAGRFVLAIGRGLPEADAVDIRVEQDRLHVSTFSTECAWQDREADPIRLPLNPTFTAVLALRLQYSQEEIARSGLTEVVNAAIERQEALVIKAAEILRPLGIGADDLRELARKCVLRAEGA